MEPNKEYLTTSILFSRRANSAIIISVAFPHVALRSPPTEIKSKLNPIMYIIHRYDNFYTHETKFHSNLEVGLYLLDQWSMQFVWFAIKNKRRKKTMLEIFAHFYTMHAKVTKFFI